MDFFEAQERARQRSKRLVFLFALAVIGTIFAGYIAAVVFIDQSSRQNQRGRSDRSYYSIEAEDRDWLHRWWNPQVFLWTAGGTLAVVGFASLYKWSQMRQGGAAVAEMVGGHRVDPRTTDFRERQLLNVVEEMSIASGIPVPAVFILDEEPALNAFAAGLTTNDAAVAVTRGTLEKLNRDELQGVIAHEFSHILNGDMRLNVRITAIVFGILVIGLIGRGMLQSIGRGRIRSSGKKDNSFAILLGLGLGLMLIGYIGYFFGRLIQAAVSRQREFLADASAVQFTRNPIGVGGALKKIGGYALGGRVSHNSAAEIGHFFFAQAFKSNFGGLWATHPPLEERIRAIDPNWDGKLFDPPTTVDVATESFATAARRTASSPNAPQPPPLRSAPPPMPFAPTVVVAAIGSLTDSHFAEAQARLEAIPADLRAAAHDFAQAPALVYALVVSGAEVPAAQTAAIIAQHASAAAAALAAAFAPTLGALPPTTRLPLLQLCLPALRQLPTAELDRFAATLDELVHADAKVTTFEFALHKMLLHQLQAASPQKRHAEFHSFQAVAESIGTVLSVVARLGDRDETASAATFAAATKELPLIADRLKLLSATAATLDAFSLALDRLALASLPIKKRLLLAIGQAISADGLITAEESDLYRAISATLDCPMPVFAREP